MRIEALRGRGVNQYAEQLRALERDMTYPIGDGADYFYIDHGEDYARFIAEMSVDANDPNAYGFLVALDGDRPVGVWGGARKTALYGDREVVSMYFGDYKVAPAYRGGRTTRAMWLAGIGLLRHRELRSIRLYYAAAMRGPRGDVMRTARGFNRIMKLSRPDAVLAIYFVAPDKLARLDLSNAPAPPTGVGLDLSPHTTA